MTDISSVAEAKALERGEDLTSTAPAASNTSSNDVHCVSSQTPCRLAMEKVFVLRPSFYQLMDTDRTTLMPPHARPRIPEQSEDELFTAWGNGSLNHRRFEG